MTIVEATHVLSQAYQKRAVVPTRRSNKHYRSREYLTASEVERLVCAARANRYGHRDATMILIAYRHGLRASEICELRWEQVDFSNATLHVTRVKRGNAPRRKPVCDRRAGCRWRIHRRIYRRSRLASPGKVKGRGDRPRHRCKPATKFLELNALLQQHAIVPTIGLARASSRGTPFLSTCPRFCSQPSTETIKEYAPVDRAQYSLLAPEALKSRCRKFGVFHRMTD